MKHEKSNLKRTAVIAVAAVLVFAAVLIVAAANRKYRVCLVDQTGESVSGGIVQFQRNGSRVTKETGQDGTASIAYDGKTYGVQVLSVPDGYLNDPSESYQVSSDEREIRLTVRSIAAQAFSFTTTDIDGRTISSEDFKDAKLILVNYWEPWCSPCLSEMPDLSALYDKYRDQGFVILGIYSDSGDDAEDIVSDYGISYPILHSNQELSNYAAAYVPASFFVNGEGKVLSQEKIVGAHSYEEWEKMILQYLEDES